MFRLTNALPSFRGGNNCEDSHTKASGEEQDQVPPLSTLPPAGAIQDPTPIQSIPPWVRELNNSRVTRHSRASSIVSTQTKFTTNTLHEDARSIDINVGGQYFRISRDGSRVTADAPPPYAGPGQVVPFREVHARDGAGLHTGTLSEWEDEDSIDDPEDSAVTPRSTFTTLDTDHGVRANILDPTEFEMPSPVGYDRLTHRSSSATLVGPVRSSNLGAATDLGEERDTPARGMQGRRAVSQDTTSSLSGLGPQSSPLRRTNGVRLPRLITGASGDIARASHRPQRFRAVASPGRSLQIRSAGAILGNVPADREPRSPDFIGRNARGTFPFPDRTASSQSTVLSRSRDTVSNEDVVVDGHSPRRDNNSPLAMDDENDISLHYARMMRTLDASHRKALLAKEKQVSELLEKLNEKDIVMRQQLRAKDFIISDLKQRLTNLEENVETMLEKARHQVEDLWEARWKDRDFHLRERMRRIEEDAQNSIDRIRAANVRSREGQMSPVPSLFQARQGESPPR